MSRADRFSTAAVALLLAAWAFPLLWMLLSSITPDERLFGDRSLIPAAPVLVHYEALFTERRFWVPIVNSLIVAGTTTVLAVTIGAPAAYAIARVRFRDGTSWRPLSCPSPCSRRLRSCRRSSWFCALRT